MSGPAGSPTEPGLRGQRRQRIARHLMGGLGHAVGLDDLGLESLLELRHHLFGQGRGGGADQPQGPAGDDFPVRRRARKNSLMNGRRGGVPGGLKAIQPAKELLRGRSPARRRCARPRSSDDRTAAIRPWIWNSGMTFRQQSCGVSASEAAILTADWQRLAWVSGTILGLDVVPEVCRTSAVSDGSARLNPATGVRPALQA